MLLWQDASCHLGRPWDYLELEPKVKEKKNKVEFQGWFGITCEPLNGKRYQRVGQKMGNPGMAGVGRDCCSNTRRGQGHLPSGSEPPQPGLEHLQGRSSLSFSGQPVPATHATTREEFPPQI